MGARCETSSTATGSWTEQDFEGREEEGWHSTHSSDSGGVGDDRVFYRAHGNFQSLCRDTDVVV